MDLCGVISENLMYIMSMQKDIPSSFSTQKRCATLKKQIKNLFKYWNGAARDQHVRFIILNENIP